MHYPPILGAMLCARHICSSWDIMGKDEERMEKERMEKDEAVWGLRDRRGLLTLKPERSAEQDATAVAKKELKPAADH